MPVRTNRECLRLSRPNSAAKTAEHSRFVFKAFSSFQKRSHCSWHTKGALLVLILQHYFEASFYCTTVVSVVGFWGPLGKQGRKSGKSEIVAGVVKVPSLPILRPAWPAGARLPSGPQHRKTRKINGPATNSEFSDFRATPRNLRAGQTLPPSQLCC